MQNARQTKAKKTDPGPVLTKKLQEGIERARMELGGNLQSL